VRRVPSALAALSAVLLFSPAPARGDQAAQWVAQAEELVRSGQPGRAAEMLRSRLEDPQARGSGEPALWAALGRAARSEGDYESAAPAFARASALGAGEESAILAAECSLEMKDGERAEELLRGLAAPAKGAAARIDQLTGMALVLRNREQEARPYLERARAGGLSSASHLLGLGAFHRGDYAAAVGLLSEAIRAEPGDYYSLLYRGWALLESNRLEEARGALAETRAVAATPEVDEMLGRLELRAGRLEAALARFQAALAVNPGYAEAQFGLAGALRRLGRKEEARKAAELFRKLHQAQEENLRKAYQLSQEQLASPGDGSIAEELSRHYLEAGDLQAAERFAWKALALEPARFTARLLLARSLAGTGLFSQAAFHYRKVLRQRPDQAEARSELEELVRRHARPRSPSDG
jgi:tetratricopeptide (TPR) repeat protein